MLSLTLVFGNIILIIFFFLSLNIETYIFISPTTAKYILRTIYDS